MKMRFLPFNVALLSLGALLVVLFLGNLLWRGAHRYPDEPRWHLLGADPERGREIITRNGCAACHVVPGVRRARGRVGPQLHDFRNQVYIAGMLPNTPENLVHWLQNPQEVNPQTAMPDLDLSEAEARDIAAYLYQNP